MRAFIRQSQMARHSLEHTAAEVSLPCSTPWQSDRVLKALRDHHWPAKKTAFRPNSLQRLRRLCFAQEAEASLTLRKPLWEVQCRQRKATRKREDCCKRGGTDTSEDKLKILSKDFVWLCSAPISNGAVNRDTRRRKDGYIQRRPSTPFRHSLRFTCQSGCSTGRPGRILGLDSSFPRRGPSAQPADERSR